MKKYILLIFVCGNLLANLAIAEVWQEREALVKISQEIEALEILIKDAERVSTQNTRLLFDYKNLQADLEKIRQGILAHLKIPMEPVIPEMSDFKLGENYSDMKK